VLVLRDSLPIFPGVTEEIISLIAIQNFLELQSQKLQPCFHFHVHRFFSVFGHLNILFPSQYYKIGSSIVFASRCALMISYLNRSICFLSVKQYFVVLLYVRTISITINYLYGLHVSIGLSHLQIIPDVMRFWFLYRT